MTNRNIKKAVISLRKKYNLNVINFDTLTDVAERLGYTVVEFNSVKNDEAVELLIDALEIKKYLASTRGLTYCSEFQRIIFVDTKLSEDEKCIVLSHELGHIQLGHLNHECIIGQDVIEEYDANQFSVLLLKDSRKTRQMLLVGAALLMCTAIIVTYFLIHNTSGKAKGNVTQAGIELSVTPTKAPTRLPTPTKKPTVTPIPTSKPERYNGEELVETGGEYGILYQNNHKYLRFDTDYGPLYHINLDDEVIESITCEYAELHSLEWKDNVLYVSVISVELPYEVLYKFDFSDESHVIMSNEHARVMEGYSGGYFIYRSVGKNYLKVIYGINETIFEIDSNSLIFMNQGNELRDMKHTGDLFYFTIYYLDELQEFHYKIDLKKTIGPI